MKYTITLGAIALALSLNSQAGVIDLTGQGYVTYGDFNTYSLPIAGIDVRSTPGHIDDLIVVATGASGKPVNTNFSGMDNAYSTPSGNSGSNFFTTGLTTDPSQISSFTGDADETWDTSLTALKGFLDGEDMVFFFNNNNLNGGNLQSLAAWAQVQVTDNTGVVPSVIGTFDFTNNGGKYALLSEGGGGNFLGDPTAYTSGGSGPTIGTNDSTDYVLSGGPLCIDTDTSPPTPVSCSNPVADEGPINHNLGADNAAYAVVAPELNSLLKGFFDGGLSLDDYTMSIDLRLGCDPGFGVLADNSNEEICTGALSGFGKNINNGFEQLFITTLARGTQIPEPSMLLLFCGSLLLLCRRKLTN
jgi:hypothetical protein